MHIVVHKSEMRPETTRDKRRINSLWYSATLERVPDNPHKNSILYRHVIAKGRKPLFQATIRTTVSFFVADAIARRYGLDFVCGPSFSYIGRPHYGGVYYFFRPDEATESTDAAEAE